MNVTPPEPQGYPLLRLASSTHDNAFASALLEHHFDDAPSGLAVFDRDLRFVRVNAAFAALATSESLAPDAFIRQLCWDTMPKLAPVLDPLLRGVLASGEALIEFEWALPHARDSDARIITLYPLREGKEIVGVGALLAESDVRKRLKSRSAPPSSDATLLLSAVAERVRAEEAVQQQDETAAILLEQVSDAVFLTDAHTVVLSVNAPACRMLGFEASELIGTSILSLMHPQDSRDAQRHMKHLEEGDAVLTLRRIRCRDGRYITIEGNHKRLGDGRFLAIVRDVTARIRQEVEIAALNQRLHRSVYESSHRIKNHLQVLASMVDMQLGEAGETLPAEAFRRLGTQIRTLSFVHDLLTRETRANAETEVISSENLLEKILSLVQQATGEKRLRFTVQNVTLPIKAGTSLALLVNEVVTNAIKHGNGQTEVTFRVEAEQGVLTVEDDGPGFPPDFDPRTAANTGLDLIESLCRTDLRGTTYYENRAEGGARVVVTFPLTLPAPER